MTAPDLALACPELERTHAFADGELAGAAADAARDHLATCAVCQAELAEILQLDAAVAEHAAADAQRAAGVTSLAWYRRRSAHLATAALAAAAAVVVIVALRTGPSTGNEIGAGPGPQGAGSAVMVALAPHRTIEARLAWPGAAPHRPYDPPRASEPPHEAIALMAIAQVDQRGDAHGVGVLELLNGERRQAATYFERAGGNGAEVLADRAALALADHQPERALSLCDAALAIAPSLGVAQWNRALALRDLGLARTAATAFRGVAALGEPGWAGEASARAKALEADTAALEQRFARLNQASVALARGELTILLDDARAMPGFARGILYDAIRSAASPAKLDQLAPIADAIDAADHDHALADALARARKALRPELARQYGDMIRALAVEQQIVPAAADDPPVPTGAARARFLAALRAGRADDLLIGVLMKTGADRQVVDRGELAELVKLTAASPDAWMQLIGVQQQAQAAMRDHDLVGAEAILLRGKQRCAAVGAPAYRCITIGRLLGRLYLDWQRLPEARAVLNDALQLARRSGEWISLGPVLQDLASLASLSDEVEVTSLPLVRAYTAEDVAWMPADPPDGRCDHAAWGRLHEAMLLVEQLKFADARRALAGPTCQTAPNPEGAANLLRVRAELIGHGSMPAELAALRADITKLRGSPDLSPAVSVELDHVEGRAIIDTEPAAGEVLLRRAITGAAELPSAIMLAHKVAGWSYSVLISAAARRGDGDRALALLAEEQTVQVPTRCVLGLAVEDEHRSIIVRGAEGKTINFSDTARTTPAIDAAHFVSADAVTALAGCSIVDVIARAPLHGQSRILPEAIAWRYLAQRARPVAPILDRALVVADVEPPAVLDLPRLATWSAFSGAARLSGPDATPGKVLTAIGNAGEVVIDAHGMVDVAQPDASFIALSPDVDGRYALTTADVRAARFRTSPLVVLAACHSSHAAPTWHATWSLPAAFIFAGARVVIASTAPIPDGDAHNFFDAVQASIRAGASPAEALRDARQQWSGRADWVRDVIVFE